MRGVAAVSMGCGRTQWLAVMAQIREAMMVGAGLHGCEVDDSYEVRARAGDGGADAVGARVVRIR